MGTTPHAPSDFQKVFNETTVSTTALVNSISASPDFWLKNLIVLQQSYSELTTSNTTLATENNTLTERIRALKDVDKELDNSYE